MPVVRQARLSSNSRTSNRAQVEVNLDRIIATDRGMCRQGIDIVTFHITEKCTERNMGNLEIYKENVLF